MIAVFTVAALMLHAPAAQPDAPPADLKAATRALERHITRGQWAEAAVLLRRLDRAVAVRAPLEVTDMQVLSAPPQGLGMYTPLFNNEVRGGELYIYAQVRNHGLRQVHGVYELHLVSDLVIYDQQGREIARDDALGESRFASRVPHRDTFVVIALRTKGLPPGRYRVQLVLHDKVADKSGKAEAPLVVP